MKVKELKAALDDLNDEDEVRVSIEDYLEEGTYSISEVAFSQLYGAVIIDVDPNGAE